MKRNTILLDIVAKFEDTNFPLWDYAKNTDFGDINTLKHFLRSMRREADWISSVLENALNRLDNPELQDKFLKIYEELKNADN